jgi:hypothetical protein
MLSRWACRSATRCDRRRQLFADDQHRAIESSAVTVDERVIDQCLAARPHRLELLRTTEPLAHARGHDDQRE